MADSSAYKSFILLIFGCSLLVQENLAEVICESLPTNIWSFAISSTGKRCSLGSYYINKQHKLETACRATEVVVRRLHGPYIESDKYVSACGMNRGFVGASPEFTQRLCSPSCYHDCPNIIDLYDNLAAVGKGMNLTTLCNEKQNLNLNSAGQHHMGDVPIIGPPDHIRAPPYRPV